MATGSSSHDTTDAGLRLSPAAHALLSRRIYDEHAGSRWRCYVTTGSPALKGLRALIAARDEDASLKSHLLDMLSLEGQTVTTSQEALDMHATHLAGTDRKDVYPFGLVILDNPDTVHNCVTVIHISAHLGFQLVSKRVALDELEEVLRALQSEQIDFEDVTSL